eukprot:scaffold26402_cov22-Tisochrysis_lutea.AAC.1
MKESGFCDVMNGVQTACSHLTALTKPIPAMCKCRRGRKRTTEAAHPLSTPISMERELVVCIPVSAFYARIVPLQCDVPKAIPSLVVLVILTGQGDKGEPEFDRLKRELEEVKQNHRGLDGTYRSQ